MINVLTFLYQVNELITAYVGLNPGLDKYGAFSREFDRVCHQIVEYLLQPPLVEQQDRVVVQNLLDVDLNLNVSLLDEHAGYLQDLFDGIVCRTLHENGCELAILEKLLVEQIVRMQTDLLTTDQNDLSLQSQIVVFQASDQPDCGFLVALQRTYHLVVDRGVEITHHP